MQETKSKINKKLLIILLAAIVIIAAVILLLCLNKPAAGNKVIAPGSIVTFGRYEQDGNEGNGQEAIRWQILSVQEDRALLISEKVLDSAPYNSHYSEITWETSSLRTWLNNEFLTAAFTTHEQTGILVTAVDNSRVQHMTGDAAGGNATDDKVYLLSAAEALSLLPEESARLCEATTYAVHQGVYTEKANGAQSAVWWLRSPGEYAEMARCADTDGKIIYSEVNDATAGIRPVLWVLTESLR